MSVLVGDKWLEAPTGSFVLVPGGTTHDFENRSFARAGLLNFSCPGDFEQHMPGIVEWFEPIPLVMPGPDTGVPMSIWPGLVRLSVRE